MALKSYRDLDVWKKAMDLVEAVYRLTAVFPEGERFGLISQMRRAAVSVPANIAEGYGRSHRGEYVHHLSISGGSLAELETHLLIANRLEFVDGNSVKPIWALTQEVGKMLSALIRSLDSKAPTRNPRPQALDPRPSL